MSYYGGVEDIIHELALRGVTLCPRNKTDLAVYDDKGKKKPGVNLVTTETLPQPTPPEPQKLMATFENAPHWFFCDPPDYGSFSTMLGVRGPSSVLVTGDVVRFTVLSSTPNIPVVGFLCSYAADGARTVLASAETVSMGGGATRFDFDEPVKVPENSKYIGIEFARAGVTEAPAVGSEGNGSRLDSVKIPPRSTAVTSYQPLVWDGANPPSWTKTTNASPYISVTCVKTFD